MCRTARPARTVTWSATSECSVYETVLVGTDGSVTASEAVARAVTLGAATGATVHVLFVGAADRADDVLRQAIAPYDEVELVTHHREGDPANAIVAAARELGADCIVVGNKGMTGARRFVLGSVPNKVTHNAPCDILVAATH